MEEISPEVVVAAQSVWLEVRTAVLSLNEPWRLTQIAVVLAIAAVAFGLSRLASPMFRAWLRQIKSSKLRLRLALMVDHRLTLIFFSLIAWPTLFALKAFTTHPQAIVLEVAATLGTTLLVIGLITRLIANPLLRQAVTWGAWAWAVIYYLGLLDQSRELLDSFAITLGTFRLSALVLIRALVTTGAMIAGARMLSHLISQRLRDNNSVSPSMEVLITKLSRVLLYTVAVVLGLEVAGFDLTGFTVFSGAVGVGLGFGLQKVVSNLVSGIIIVLDKSVKPGDVISLGDTFGWIESLGARYVSVVALDGKEYLIPNEDLVTGQVVNWSHSNDFVRVDLFFGTSYADDPHIVTDIAVKAAMSVDRASKIRKPVCWISEFGNSSINYELRFWITDARGGLSNVKGEIYMALWDKFQERGIIIPFPQREVRMVTPALDPPVGIGGDSPPGEDSPKTSVKP